MAGTIGPVIGFSYFGFGPAGRDGAPGVTQRGGPVLYAFQDKRGGYPFLYHFPVDRVSFEFPVIGDNNPFIRADFEVYSRLIETDVRHAGHGGLGG